MSKSSIKLLTEEEITRFIEFTKRLSPADLEMLSKLIWDARKAQYREWDKNISSHPLKKHGR